MKKLLFLSMLTIIFSRISATDNPASKDIEIIHQLLKKHYPKSTDSDFFKIDANTGTMTRFSQSELDGKYITLEKINLRDPQVGFPPWAVGLAAALGIGFGGLVVATLMVK